MTRRPIRAPSPGTVIGVLALVVAMSGTSYAAVSSINGSQLKNRSVSHLKIIKNTLTGAEVNESTLGKVPKAAVADTAKALPTPAFHALTLGTGWTQNTVFTGRRLGWTRDLQGYVHLQGAATQSTGSDPILGSIPASIAPVDFTYFPVYTANGTIGSLYIDSSGQIHLFTGTPSFVMLEGITFLPGS